MAGWMYPIKYLYANEFVGIPQKIAENTVNVYRLVQCKFVVNL